MQLHTLILPDRETKPREHGVTMMIDHGLPTDYFADVMASFGDMIDFVKFGWGTCLATPDIAVKAGAATRHGVDFYFGGTLFEKFVINDKVDEWYKLCHESGARTVEISNGTIPLSNDDKSDYVRRFSEEFTVLSEVGFKDPVRSETLSPAKWLRYIRQDLDAGARFVIAEARESWRSGICRANGALRFGLIEEFADSGIDLGRLIFEAPTKELQTYLLRRLGAQANLGNIAPDDIVGLETLRLGLRADTLTAFDTEEETHA